MDSRTIWKRIFEMAGTVGIDPCPLTLGQLVQMYYGKQRDEWDKFAAVLSMVSSLGGVKTSPEKINPYSIKAEKKVGGSVKDLQNFVSKMNKSSSTRRK